MDIQYFEPLSRGYGRMKKALFQPFDLKKWFVVGFTAFLAGLTDWHGGNGSGGGQGSGRVDWDDVIYFPERARDWLLENPHWLLLIGLGLCLLFLLVVLCTWLSARGKFMFLDNVVHDRAHVASPWHEYRAEGDSLFLWNFTFGLLVVAIIVGYLVKCYAGIVEVYEQFWNPRALIAPAILMVLGLIAMILVVVFIELLLVDFVVPIMYRSRLRVLAAWKVFLRLFRIRVSVFLGYVFLVVLLRIAIAIGIFFAVVFTCCIGLIFLVIPYINAVVLLPISYTMRAFSVEFLEQFGPEYAFFPRGEGIEGVQGTKP